MVAVNVELESTDLALAQTIADGLRERDGGLPGVRALGFALESHGTVQVSMNLVDLTATGIERACGEVRRKAEAAGITSRFELVGLIPATELARCSDEFRVWSGLTKADTVEARVAKS